MGLIFTALYLPIMCVVWTYGNKLEYYFAAKEVFAMANILIFLLCIPLVVLFYFLSKNLNRRRVSFDKWWAKLILVAALVLIYWFLYYVNVYIARCIVFQQGWDVSCVVGAVYRLSDNENLGRDAYFELYPNNIPITYVLYKIYSKVSDSYIYFKEFYWIQIVCGMISVAGFMLSSLVAKITNKILPTFVATGIYCVLMAFLPQKIVPYTDMFSLCFPITILCFYAFYVLSKSKYKYVYLLPIVLFSVLGGLIKTTVFVVFIAIVITELVRGIVSAKSRKYDLMALLASIILVGVLTVSLNFFFSKSMGFIPDKSQAVSWQHYFYMGMMDETDGAFNAKSLDIIDEYTDISVSQRHVAEIEAGLDIVKNRSFSENVMHYVKKMVMTFNDGTFTWFGEGAAHFAEYPSISGSRFKEFLQNLFWYGGEHYIVFTTVCQYIWFFILIGLVPFGMQIFSIAKGGTDDKKWIYMSLVMSLVGIFLFIALFEARARYLINFIPVFITCSILGFDYIFAKISK